MTATATDLVCQLQDRIADKLGPQRYKVWFKNATEFTFADGILKVGVPNHFIGGWIENHFAGEIAEAAREITGRDYEVSYSIDPELARNLRKRQPDSQVDFAANNPERIARHHKRLHAAPAPPTLRCKLQDFVVGPSNQLAYGATTSIVEGQGRFNPLFIHSGCGLGKTHLLQGLCNALKDRRPDVNSIYVTGEDFTNQFIYAVKMGHADAFRHRFRNVDVLAIDDVHFLANKRATQEEFLHTFNAIEAGGKQVVLASDAHPKMIGQFSESLVSRFVAGMVVRIESPDLETRREILRRGAAKLHRDIPDSIIEYIALELRANVRELEGALLKLLAFASISHQPLTLALAKQALADHLSRTAPIVHLSDIESIVSMYFGLTPADLHTSRKTRTIALARGISMYLARKHTDMSFPEIGRFMGNKNHSTVILASRKIDKLLKEEATVRWTTPSGEKRAPICQIFEVLAEQLGDKTPDE